VPTQTDIFQAETDNIQSTLLNRHRLEWSEVDGFRKAALAVMKAAHEKGGKEQWQIAKIAAETARANIQALSIKQTHERLAFGLSSSFQLIETNNKRITEISDDELARIAASGGG